MVQRISFIVFLFFLFVLESTWFQWISPDVWGSDYTVIPELSLIVMMFVTIFIGIRQGIVYSLIIGLMQDLAFGRTIGIYMFSFTLIVYLVGTLMQQLYKSNAAVSFAVIFSIGSHLLLLYGLYRLFDITEMGWETMFYYHFLPSFIINSVFVFLLIRPLKRWFHRMGVSMEQ